MAERPDAYFRKNPGDVIQSNEWNELQVKAREEIRAHRHTGSEDGSLIPRAGIEAGAIDGKLIDPAAEVSVKTLTTSGNITVKGDLAVNGKALLGDIADLLATVKGLQDDKLNRRGDSVSGTLRVQRNFLVDGRVGVGTSDACTKLEVIGGALISNGSGFAVQANYMASGSLTIGGTSTGYGGGWGWGSSTAGLLLETKGTTEIAVHDAGTRLTSLLYYNDNRITIGRDMGWNVTPVIVAGNMGIGTRNPDAKLHLVDVPQDAHGHTLLIGQTDASNLRLGCHNDYTWMQSHNSRHLVLNPLGNNVGIGTTTPSRKLQIGPDVDGLGFELAQASPNSGVFRFGDNSGWKLHFGRSREIPNGGLNSGLSGVLMTIKDNGYVGIGTTTPLAKLHVEGDIRVEGGDVTVNGAVRAKALQTTLYAAGGGGPLPMSSDNVWRDVGDLAVSVSLSQPAMALVFYQITMPGSQHLVTRLAVDNNPIWQTRAITGDTRYWSPSSLWMGTLAAGAHVIKVQYRTPTGGTNNPSGDDWQNRALNVLILGAA